jgi:hypothetical protein
VPAAAVYGLSLLFVFLILAAQYESWSLPFSVLLSTPIAVFGAMGALLLRRMEGQPFENNVYAQIGTVMLIGLAAKNAILIVQFAKAELEKGETILDAALNGARIRLRPILMTSFAMIAGLAPLWVASGAGAVSRKILGTAVIGGMAAATGLAIFIVPVGFYVVESLIHRFARPHETTPHREGQHAARGRVGLQDHPGGIRHDVPVGRRLEQVQVPRLLVLDDRAGRQELVLLPPQRPFDGDQILVLLPQGLLDRLAVDGIAEGPGDRAAVRLALHEVVLGAAAHRAGGHLLVGSAREDHHGHRRRHREDPFDRGGAVGIGQPEVQEDRVESFLPELLERGLQGLRPRHVELARADVGQGLFQQGGIGSVVLDQQDVLFSRFHARVLGP